MNDSNAEGAALNAAHCLLEFHVAAQGNEVTVLVLVFQKNGGCVGNRIDLLDLLHQHQVGDGGALQLEAAKVIAKSGLHLHGGSGGQVRNQIQFDWLHS